MAQISKPSMGEPQPQTVQSGTGIERIRQIVAHSDNLIDELRNIAFDPTAEKQLKRRYTITQVAEMVGRSANGIRKAEAAGALPQPTLNEQGRRSGYSLAEVNQIREHFGIRPGRGPGD